MEEHKVDSNNTSILIVILCIMLIIVCGYIVIDKMNSNKNQNEELKQVIEDKDKKTDDYEELDINTDIVINNYNKIKNTTGMCNTLDVTYTKKYQKVSDFSNDLLLGLSLKKVSNAYFIQDGPESIIKEEYLKESFDDIFGNNAQYSPSDFRYGFDRLTYNNEKKEYRTNNEMLPLPGRCAVDQVEQVIEAKKNKEYLVITTVTAYCNESVCYSDFKQENKIGDNKIDFKSVKDKLRKFRYTFNTNDEVKYYFYSVENLND